jgi:L-iditol 2-dehydrogenase
VKVARIHGAADVRVHDEPRPIPGSGETLVRVMAVGLCGSDLHWYAEAGIGADRLERPLILGHEFAGVTPEGQMVAVDPCVPCQECEFCLEGNPNLCARQRFAGHSRQDGGLTEYIAWPSRCLVPLPAGMTAVEGALLEPLGVALHAVDLAHLRPGLPVGVFGCGPIGLLVLLVAKAAGAGPIFATEPLPHRLAAALRLGAEPWDGRQTVDVAFECAGENEAVDDAVDAARPGGRVILVGIPASDRTSFSASVARRKGLSIKLSRRMKHAYPRAIRLASSGQVDLLSLATHRLPLAEAGAAFALAQARTGLKIIVEPCSVHGDTHE